MSTGREVVYILPYEVACLAVPTMASVDADVFAAQLYVILLAARNAKQRCMFTLSLPNSAARIAT